MIKKIYLIIVLISLNLFSFAYSGNIKIIATVDGEIITNFDLKKEYNYLELLNPDLALLSDNQKFEIAKKSLIKELIKTKEIEKFFDTGAANEFVDNYLENYLKDLFLKLNVDNNQEFEEKIKLKDTFNLVEIENKIKIELFWNELIFSRFKDQLDVDNERIIAKVEKLGNKQYKEFYLSEIVFKKKKSLSIEDLIKEINLSINEIGFNNTANIFSKSESSKYGGKIGWVNKNSLSKQIYNELKLIKEGEFTNVIKLGNDYLIIKIEEIKVTEKKIDKEKEVNRLIKLETNKQLNKFSIIYFDKSKINYSINES
jgi:peptidyl-prolyl cis-trans isomerase SurA